ncbi:vomeronasal type-2 receptor 116-like [Mastomys coucha]|uniref:vomeronasal type-2 receptor 116-like n=1 Tax=Mastomys coucha TaxID=35658 RepID=UPI0012613C7C|nr:vomeronasal type-2 receptor 116-like [Mastomys coucha]
MFYWIFISWFLQIPKFVFTILTVNISLCFYKTPEDFHHEGDVVIGAFFLIHTYYSPNKVPHPFLPYQYMDNYLQYNFKNYQYILALVFAIEEINGNPNILPNTSLGFDFYNVRFTEKETLMNVCFWLTAQGQKKILPNYNCAKHNFTTALTGTSWTTSAQIGTLLQLFKFPQLSFGPYDPILSDRGRYSSLYQMAPKYSSISLGIVSLMVHFRWSWVGLILPHENGEAVAFFPWQLNIFLKDIDERDNMSLGLRQKLNAEYDILNLWNLPKGLGQKVKIGSFLANAPEGQQLSLSEPMIQWAGGFSEIPQSVCSESCVPGFRKVILEGTAICCYNCTPCADNEISNETDVDQCVKCPESHYANTEKNHCFQKAVSFLAYEDPLGMTLASMALCLSALTAFVIGIFVKHRDTPIVKANNRGLSYTLLITITFCLLCSLNFIGQPNAASCILQQTIFGVAFTVALATVLAKAITVVIAFKATFPGRMVRWLMTSRAPNYIIPLCTLIQLLLCGIWMATSPPFIDQDFHAEHGHILLFCNKGSSVAFHCVLGYLCFLALGGYTMAFLSRNLPDTFNESKFLSFSMLVFFCVWVTFLPVYHSTKGKVMVAMEVFSILASSAALLGFIFAPKCYIILLRPDKNSFHQIRNKTHSRRNKSLKI